MAAPLHATQNNWSARFRWSEFRFWLWPTACVGWSRHFALSIARAKVAFAVCCTLRSPFWWGAWALNFPSLVFIMNLVVPTPMHSLSFIAGPDSECAEASCILLDSTADSGMAWAYYPDFSSHAPEPWKQSKTALPQVQLFLSCVKDCSGYQSTSTMKSIMKSQTATGSTWVRCCAPFGGMTASMCAAKVNSAHRPRSSLLGHTRTVCSLSSAFVQRPCPQRNVHGTCAALPFGRSRRTLLPMVLALLCHRCLCKQIPQCSHSVPASSDL